MGTLRRQGDGTRQQGESSMDSESPVPVLVQAPDPRLAAAVVERLRDIPSVDVRSDGGGKPSVAVVVPDGWTEDHLPSVEVMLGGIRGAAAGVGFVPLAASWQASSTDPASLLQPREVEVLRLVAEGHDTVEIARKLNYSERTVKNVIHQITQRLGLRNRPHAVAYAIKHGLLWRCGRFGSSAVLAVRCISLFFIVFW
jgi:DNA-binding CsgD family transcriptional regulator